MSEEKINQILRNQLSIMREIKVIKNVPVFDQFHIAVKNTINLLPEYENKKESTFQEKTKDALSEESE